ncbi:hypothetical protein [Halogranum rubrum]|uniref:hypothetical protein n=1 Tax=Halogranum rubrum TaxID=553466 RepID=UPI000B7D8E19|nr:hypothetical protein [Halogranum rubrum]
MYQRPPKTTEEVLHNLSPETEPPTPLSVSVESDSSDGSAAANDWKRLGDDQMGELFLRVALREELSRSAAVSGADGWGNDTQIEFTSEGRTGYAWALRWDDTANATEFETVLTEYLDSRAEKRGETWVDTEDGETSHFRSIRAGADIVVVFAGHEEFVDGATAEAQAGNVTVTT